MNEVVASQSSYGAQILAKYYVRWFSLYPEMRKLLVVAIKRDCVDTKGAFGYLEDKVWTEVLDEENLSVDDKAQMFLFMLRNENSYFLNKESVTSTIKRLLETEEVDIELQKKIKDACVSAGLML